MISKERLQELIEQEKTVWCASELCGSNKLKLHNKDVRDSDCFHISKTYRVPLQLLFETEQEYLKHKEEAEFIKKYHTTRVERFEPPTYEEFIDEDFYFYWFIAKSTQRARICKKDNSIFVELGVDENLYEFQFNKDGYIKAVEYARKLFIGEE